MSDRKLVYSRLDSMDDLRPYAAGQAAGLTRETLHRQMAEMGLTPADKVLIHTSLRAVGPVKGGANGLIDAFLSYLTEGLFMVPTHTWANVGPAQPHYDVRATEPCIGTLPRVAARRKDGVRSLHPTHSIWACGRGAREFVAGEEKALTPAPPGFAWDRLADIGAKILLIGVGYNRNTFIHSIDERAELPNRLRGARYEVTITDYEGRVYPGSMQGHCAADSEDLAEYYINFEQPLIEMGAQTAGKLGNAEVKVIDAARCQEIVLRMYSRAPESYFTRRQVIPPELYR